tara:strand:+ start:461 stop:790 length:330 start_codon:yes stop_codon:yes gene_type:complete
MTTTTTADERIQIPGREPLVGAIEAATRHLDAMLEYLGGVLGVGVEAHYQLDAAEAMKQAENAARQMVRVEEARRDLARAVAHLEGFEAAAANALLGSSVCTDHLGASS